MISLIYNIEDRKVTEYIGSIQGNDINNCIQSIFYDNEEFHLYHQKNANSVYKILIKRCKKTIAYCYIGVKENVVLAPYSSPFSMIYTKENCSVNDINEIIKAIIEITKYLNCKKIKFTLPPEIYYKENINLIYSAFNSNGFKIRTIDINNYFDLNIYENFNIFLLSLDRRTRQNYNRAVKSELQFYKVNEEEFDDAYDVIKKSKEELHYPLKISRNQMKDITNMKSSNVRYFIVKKERENIASAIVFDVTKDISQVIYVGDIIEYRNMRPMDMLYAELINYYKKEGKRYLDFGPSGENGIINIGLADFKKSMGLNSTIKVCFEYNL